MVYTMNIVEALGSAALIICFVIATLYQVLYVVYYLAGLRSVNRNGNVVKSSTARKGVSILVSMKGEPMDKIEALIKNFINSELSKYGELIIVSHDDYNDYVKIREVVDKTRGGVDNVILMWREGGKGFKAGAINAALWLARYDYILVIDIDSVFNSDFVFQAIDLLEKNAEFVAVTSRWRGLNRETTVSETLWYVMEFEVNTLYRGRYSLGLPVFTLGAGTVYRRDYVREVLKGWSEDNIVEDIDAGLRIIMGGRRTAFLDDHVVLVEVTNRLSSLKIQQERWVYGALYTFKKYLRRLFLSPINPLVKLELSLYLNQYLSSALFFLGVLVSSIISVIYGKDLVLEHLPFATAWFISFTLFSLCLAHVIHSYTRNVWKTIVILGRSGVIHNYLSHTILKSIMRFLLGYPLEFRRTPKGEFEKKLVSKPLSEYILASLFTILTIALLIRRLVIVTGFTFMFALTYVYLNVRREKWL